MSARVAALDAEAVDDLPSRCRRCLYWELGAPRPGERDTTAEEHAARVRKQAWVTSRSLEDGPPGVVLRVDRHVRGYALFAPAPAFTRRAPGVPRIADDALWLATAWLDPGARAANAGRLLVQAAVRDAIARDLDAVEAYGDRRAREWDCVLPATWLLHEGFEVAREHPRYPVLRLATRRTARWASSLEHAAHELLGRVPRPVPVGQATSTPGAVAPAQHGGVAQARDATAARRALAACGPPRDHDASAATIASAIRCR